MKKSILGWGLIFLGFSAYSQNGLECVTVEKYYISNAADAIQADDDATNAGYPTGALPAGSVTYRIYADMLQGYKLLSVYADITRSQPLLVTTTTSFYNNPLGDIKPSSTKTAIKNNLLAIDSWFSMGGVCTGNYGVPKTTDDGVANNITVAGNSAGVLLNNDANAGIPLTTQDGMLAGTGIQAASFSGITNEGDVFTDGSVVGDTFALADGSWYTPNGAKGRDTVTNEVLIAQITTNGVLHFELNLFIKTPTGTGQNFVAKNPDIGDIQLACLTYSSDDVTAVNNLNSFSPFFKVYPNPASNLLTLEIPSTQSRNTSNSYTLHGIVGNVIAHKNIGAISEKYVETIDISSLAKGIYFMQLTVDGVTSTRKIIKN